MTSHELAKKLLALPDIKVLVDEPRLTEIIDEDHPDFINCPAYISQSPHQEQNKPYEIWWNSQPKIQIISLGD